MIRFAMAMVLAAACSSSAQYEPIPDPPGPQTTGALAGPLCEGQSCKCRTDDESPGVPEGTAKRYEFRIGPSDNEVWATVGDAVLYKSREHATDCFYVDLPAGDHAVTLHAKGDNGFGAQLSISELGAKGPWWYDTFLFRCGAPGMCDQETLASWKKEVTARGAKHDPCGSTKVNALTWQTGTMPDNIHPSEILVRLTLQIYDFVPEFAPGHANCSKHASDQ